MCIVYNIILYTCFITHFLLLRYPYFEIKALHITIIVSLTMFTDIGQWSEHILKEILDLNVSYDLHRSFMLSQSCNS